MCGISGFTRVSGNSQNDRDIINNMVNVQRHRGPDSSGVWDCDEVIIGHNRLAIVDISGGAQPMTKICGEHKYVITYNGELYNTEELRNKLLILGHTFKTYSDTEVLLTSYIEWGTDCLDYMNGIFAFAIWDDFEKRFFLARDRFGVKPLFYSFTGEQLIFSSEIKGILQHPKIKPSISEEGIAEIFGLSPSRTCGNGVFDGIYEVRPAHYMIYSGGNLREFRYWQFKSKPHEHNMSSTAECLNHLVKDAVTRQMVSDVEISTFLSGGLDSSTITGIVAQNFLKESGKQLSTYSFDYVDNNKYFKSGIFQPSSDEQWVKKMVDEFQTKHNILLADCSDLINNLNKVVTARDLPGMADIDSSLIYYCSLIKQNHSVALSGECADEFFGGYPWFYNQNLIVNNGFPWLHSLQARISLLKPEVEEYAQVEKYVKMRYLETIESTPYLEGESASDARKRELFYLNIIWFMGLLLERKDRMSMASGLEVRVPFCDYKLADYVWNIPWNLKFLAQQEKGILRLALKGILPDEILYRKKSPYPKTYNPLYAKEVKRLLVEVLENPDSPILSLIDKKSVYYYINQPDLYSMPFFGQLMATPQMFAFLLQVNFWLKHYKISLK